MERRIDSVLRQNNGLESNNTNMEADFNRLTNRVKSAEDALKELRAALSYGKTEKKRLQEVFCEKTKQADNLIMLAYQFDPKLFLLNLIPNRQWEVVFGSVDSAGGGGIGTEIRRRPGGPDFGCEFNEKLGELMISTQTCQKLSQFD
ncbi:hypothetical protein GCK72_022984 [Caenorhabditis remanei]|uniref:Uncharacterized protein n=1 Tax=Caenorhabditis remanei TaxID=31234 RepID=A0A6A5FV87_CAERE|nr:hypothetical protein GCK72_022984 [Caenorhabditis remanei]KAF1746528.1 hypothetical protein GCK72_022984 [Caenorhabditis remanei]